MSPIVTATVVVSVLLAAGLLLVLFCLLAVAQSGGPDAEEMTRRRRTEPAIKPVRRRPEPGQAYFAARASKPRGSESNSPNKGVLSV
jgi:hypothetical protein